MYSSPNFVRYITCDRRQRSMHLLQHKLQVLHCALHARVCRQELEIDCVTSCLRSLLCSPLVYHLGLLDHSREEGLRLLGPLLKILLFAGEFFPTTQALHVEEVRSVLLRLGIREVVSTDTLPHPRSSHVAELRATFTLVASPINSLPCSRNVTLCHIAWVLFPGPLKRNARASVIDFKNRYNT